MKIVFIVQYKSRGGASCVQVFSTREKANEFRAQVLRRDSATVHVKPVA